jgi:ribosomal protein S18 acetylase RimI-like enzyme
MEKNTLVIRDAGFEDIDDLVGLLEQLFSIETDFEFNPKKHCKGLALMLEGCGKHRAVKVAVHGNKIVGMCTAQTRISTAAGGVSAVLEDLVVTEDYQGQGIGSALLDQIHLWAAKRGITRLQLLADKNNTSALDFYSSRKWQQTDLICLTRTI